MERVWLLNPLQVSLPRTAAVLPYNMQKGKLPGGRVLYDSALKINEKPQMRRVGYLFQNYALFPNVSVEENIAAGLKGMEKKRQK